MEKNKSQNQIKDLITLFEIASVNRTVIEDAIKSTFTDFEDSVIHQAANHAGSEGIVTRDPKGFKQSKLPVYSPIELLKIFKLLNNK